uniref:RBR-type E3 ubiquitin transferase n=1 Tax=Caenorhabditis tropicalis TaxID=1561998 RepID=A0A1I7T1J3_9PELO
MDVNDVIDICCNCFFHPLADLSETDSHQDSNLAEHLMKHLPTWIHCLQRPVHLSCTGASHGVCRQAIQIVDNGECSICCDEVSVLGFECEHFACSQCWKQYLDINIDKPRIGCIDPECLYVVCADSLRELGGDVEVQSQVIRNDFVDRSPNIVWCPSKDCQLAVKSDSVGTVKCQCGLLFCFRFRLDSHLPATCIQVRNWEKRDNALLTSDGKSLDWIHKNTKDCPKCMSPIEKSGGCDHIRCQKCHYDFCWYCGVQWFQHGAGCSLFDVREDAKRLRNRLNKRCSLTLSKRYKMHSEQLEREKLFKYKHKYPNIQNSLNVLLQSRRTLMYSIISDAYFNGMGFEGFKMLQKNLETSVGVFSNLMNLRQTEYVKLKKSEDYTCFDGTRQVFNANRWASYEKSDNYDSLKVRINAYALMTTNETDRIRENDAKGVNKSVPLIEHIIPLQTHACCYSVEYVPFDVMCLFYPEDNLESWFENGGKCNEGYVLKDHLCELVAPKTVFIPTNTPEIPSTTKEPVPPPTTSPTPSDVYIPPNLPSSTNSPEEVSSRAPIPSDPPVIRRPAPPKQTKEDADLERRLKKYLAEETDGDEPDEEKDEEYYYDYDSCSSFSIVVPFVFVMLGLFSQ